jgi:hypothetical protein
MASRPFHPRFHAQLWLEVGISRPPDVGRLHMVRCQMEVMAPSVHPRHMCIQKNESEAFGCMGAGYSVICFSMHTAASHHAPCSQVPNNLHSTAPVAATESTNFAEY